MIRARYRKCCFFQKLSILGRAASSSFFALHLPGEIPDGCHEGDGVLIRGAICGAEIRL